MKVCYSYDVDKIINVSLHSDVMTDVFSDLLETIEIEHVPIKIKKFLHRRDPTTYANTWGLLAHAYSAGFEELAKKAMEAWPRREYLVIPVFFLARHSIELHLKEAILEYADAGEPTPELGKHNLIKLWNRLLDHLTRWGIPIDDKWTIHCGKLIEHIHERDPDGERFRYPTTTAGEQFDSTEIELRGLAEAYVHITTYCEACVQMHNEDYHG